MGKYKAAVMLADHKGINNYTQLLQEAMKFMSQVMT